MKVIRSFFRGIGAILVVMMILVGFVVAAALLQTTGTKVLAITQDGEKDISILHYYGEETGVYYQFSYPKGEVLGTKLVPRWVMDIDDEFLKTEFAGLLQVFPQKSGEIKIVLKDHGSEGVPSMEIAEGFFPSGTPPEEIALAISNHRE